MFFSFGNLSNDAGDNSSDEMIFENIVAKGFGVIQKADAFYLKEKF